jgi:hypothetical protein
MCGVRVCLLSFLVSKVAAFVEWQRHRTSAVYRSIPAIQDTVTEEPGPFLTPLLLRYSVVIIKRRGIAHLAPGFNHRDIHSALQALLRSSRCPPRPVGVSHRGLFRSSVDDGEATLLRWALHALRYANVFSDKISK